MLSLVLVIVLSSIIISVCFVSDEVVEMNEMLFKVNSCFIDECNIQYVIVAQGDEELARDHWYIAEVYDVKGDYINLCNVHHNQFKEMQQVVDITIMSNAEYKLVDQEIDLGNFL